MASEKLKVLEGTCGNAETPCDVLIYKVDMYCVMRLDGSVTTVGTWYCVDGGSMVNLTYADLEYIEDEYGVVNVELLSDEECFTWNKPINTLEELEEAVNA